MKQRKRSARSRYVVGSIHKALLMLEALAAAGSDGMTVSELARTLDLSKSTVFASLQTLATHDFVNDIREGDNRRYRLGMALARLGEETVSNISLTEVGLPVLRSLTKQCGLTSRLAVMQGGHAVIVACVQARRAVRFANYLGHQELLHCSAIGKALLSMQEPQRARALLRRIGLVRRTEKTITEQRQLLQELALVRRRGYAVDDEEDTRGVLCVGAAAADRDGGPACALSVTGLKWADRERSTARLGEIVRAHADRLAELLGGPSYADWLKRAARGSGVRQLAHRRSRREQSHAAP